MVNHVVYHYFQAADLGLPFVVPPELTEEEELWVAILISTEGERKAFLGIEDALALSMAPPPPPGPPRQTPRAPLGHAATMPGWIPGMCGLEPCLRGRQPRRRSLAGLP
jgi:hypothetical protein